MAREIFRKDADIYAVENDTARKLGSTEFMRDFAPKAGTVVEPTGERVLGGGDVRDLGQRADLYDQYFTPPQPASSALAAVNQAPVVSDGTQDIRDNMFFMNSDLTNKITGAESRVETPASSLTRLQSEYERMKMTTDEDLAAIEAAGEQARLAFEPIVEEQETNRKYTLPAEVVRAGERGGFLSTQQAGVAALLPTDKRKGEAFVGAGGALDQKRQTLDRAVTLAKTKQQEAIAQAKDAQRAAIMTGKRQDFDVAVKLAELAEEFANNAETLNMQKQRLTIDYSAENRALRADDRAATAANIQNIADVRALATDSLDKLTQANTPLANISAQEKEILAQQLGISTSTFDNFYTSLQSAKEAAAAGNELELSKNLVDVLSKVPDDQQIQIGDSLYSGFKEGQKFNTFKEDASGNVTQVITDGDGNIIAKNDLGRIGKGFKASGGSGKKKKEEEIPLTYGQFEQGFMNEMGTEIALESQDILDGYEKYLEEFEALKEAPDFTATQKLKLEQAGLIDASRQEQLDHLFLTDDGDLF